MIGNGLRSGQEMRDRLNSEEMALSGMESSQKELGQAQ